MRTERQRTRQAEKQRSLEAIVCSASGSSAGHSSLFASNVLGIQLKLVILTFYENKTLSNVGSPTDLKVTNPSETDVSK